MPLLIAVTGSTPGVGKSTLCAALDEALSAAGRRVDHFREEEILTRPAFARVAAEFASTKRVTPAALVQATAAYARTVDDIAVTDALLPYLPSMLAWGHGEHELAGFVADLGEAVGDTATVVVHLDGDPATALPRAIAREEAGWIDWYVRKLDSYDPDPPVADTVGAVAHLERERATTRRLLESGPFPVVHIERADERPSGEVLALALAGIEAAMDARAAGE
ncbi:hypothetical protein AB0I28_05375 [Phytomonospora sp. NPDC050363]|uniref:hypothetical protein n=1 Tax=Phytomonospora sp. NPDC050363 TaxID=3155642 RepID=UPI0033FBA454